MTRRHALPIWSATLSLLLALGLTGCPSDPYDPATWIDKLDDANPQEVQRAITELQRLKMEPGIDKAIAPLAKVWEKQNRPTKVLRVIIELADESKGGPYWENAVPVLRTAVDEFDVGDERSIQNAIAAADALGKAKDKDSIQTLIRAVNKQMPKLSAGQRVRLAAISALGKFGDEKRAVEALLKVLEADPKEQPPTLFAAAALALADARSADAIEPLIVALFKIPMIFPQARRALIATGKPAVPKLISIFKGEDKVLNQLAKDNKFNVNCDKGMGEETTCVAPTNLEYKSALLLGDFYATEAVKPLMAGLKAPPLPSFFEGGAPGPSQHTAILDSLRKIGESEAADAVWSYATASDTDDAVRPLALDVYSFLTTDTKNLKDMATMIKDDDADEQVRLAAGIAYGRLARAEDQYEPIMFMINRYKKRADEKEASAKKAKDAFEKAKKSYDALAAKEKDPKKPGKATAKAKSEMESKQQASSILEGEVGGYRNFQRTFEQNLARAHVGTMCKQDPKCYAGVLDKPVDDLGKDLGKYIKDWKDWSEREKKDLQVASIDRALMELRKLGVKARPVVDKLLEQVESTDRITRQGILLALVKIAELPCDKCVKRLAEVMESQKDQSTLQALTVETEAIRNFFLWAGK
jgi:tetratricopeptide (TPR) repeat protein